MFSDKSGVWLNSSVAVFAEISQINHRFAGTGEICWTDGQTQFEFQLEQKMLLFPIFHS